MDILCSTNLKKESSSESFTYSKTFFKTAAGQTLVALTGGNPYLANISAVSPAQLEQFYYAIDLFCHDLEEPGKLRTGPSESLGLWTPRRLAHPDRGLSLPVV